MTYVLFALFALPLIALAWLVVWLFVQLIGALVDLAAHQHPRRAGAAAIAIRIPLAALALILGVLLVVIGVLVSTRDDSVRRTISNSHTIEAQLRQSAGFARSFLETNGRLPNGDDIERWQREAPNSSRGLTWFQDPPFEPEVLERFGQPPQTAKQPFVVTYWRGEWYEYYSSWADSTSLEFDPSKYYILGSSYAESGILVALGVVLIGLAYLAWPRSADRNDA